MSDSARPYICLPKGGILIPTAGGNIQFGIPSETIKDTMTLEGGVPATYIVPNFMFDITRGVSLADVEFPIYFNFFIKKGKTRIVCSENQRKRIENVISEALFGPESIDVRDEFVEGEDTPGFTTLKAEMDYFKKMPMTPKGMLSLDDLVEFSVFDDKKTTRFNDIEVQFDSHYNLRVSEKGKEIALIERNVPIIPRESAVSGLQLNFRPPLFGITTLGSGHGFDPNANTSGLIIWVNRRGIVVDPPVNSTGHLLQLGVSPKLIDKVILTHCHADHDAGTLQKILQEGKVDLYTTSTIFRSFIKKSAALTGIEEEQLKKLVNFFPVPIGEMIIISGGKFNFNYTLHSIPTISIQASLYGKSMIYSSDTMNDPAYIEKLYEEGVLTKNRRDFLVNFPWNQDVIFHEAGIPPIHTPLSYLCSLPKETQERMYLVHVSPDSIPKDSGMRIAPTGLQSTIELDVHPLPYERAIEILDAFSHVDLFENLTFNKAREFLLACQVSNHRAGEIIFHKGDKGDKFYVVMAGEVDIVLDGKLITTYGIGGYFGEKSLFIHEYRTATIIAKSDVRLLSVQKDEMLSFIRGTESEYLLHQIAKFQNVELRESLKNNSILGALAATQQTQLHGLVKPYKKTFHAGEIIYSDKTESKYAYVIMEGSVNVYRGNDLISTLTKGGMFGMQRFFKKDEKYDFSLIAMDDVRLYYIEYEELRKYLDKNPGVYIKLYHYPY
jgi:CRP-like cAMP-binding protein